jgi:spore maturation protein CgeB
MRFDFARDIFAGRVEFILGGADLIAHISREMSGFFPWPHPILGQCYEDEASLLAPGRMESCTCRRAMVVSGGLFVSDVADALRENQVQVMSWDPRAVSKEETLYQFRRFEPHMVVSINFCRGLPEICEALSIPFVVWEIDPSIERVAPEGSSVHHTRIYTYRKAHVTRYKEAGFRHVEYLPLGANPRRRFPMALSEAEKKKYEAHVSFVGSSMIDQAQSLSKLYDRLAEKLSPDSLMNGKLADCRAAGQHAPGGHGNMPGYDSIDDIFPEHATPLDPERFVRDEQGRLIDLAFCVWETAASRRRVRVVSNIEAPTVKVWGDQHWSGCLPTRVRYCGPAGHQRELTMIYNASAINLDINRLYQKDIVTMRVFDVLACQGFVLADHGDDLPELFHPDGEVVSYRSTTELQSLIDHFLAHEEERRQVAKAGYERVIKDHTISRRIQSILQDLP